MQQKQAALSELKAQMQNVQDDVQKQRAQLAAMKARYNETSVGVLSKVEEKENHNQSQTGHVAHLEEEVQQLTVAARMLVEQIDSTATTLVLKKEQAEKLQLVEKQVTQLKNTLEEDDCALMQLDSALSRNEAATTRRYSEIAEKLASYPLPQVVSTDTNSLEGTAGESVILVDEF